MDFKKDVLIYDIETPKEAFLCAFYDIFEEKYYTFEVNKYKNELFQLLKYFENNKAKYFTGWNNLGFDSQVIEYIWRNYENWHNYTNLQIAETIHIYANKVIEDKNYNTFSEFRENELTFKQIDLFKIHHLDNKNRISNGSLKAMEYYLDMDLELFDFQLDRHFEEKDLEELKYYCIHDLKATYQMYLLTIGETDNPVYKDNNQIEIRLNIEEKYNIPCLNYSNSKIGDEIIKKFYCEEKGIEYKNLPKKGFFRKEIPLKFCVPNYITFKSKLLQDVLNDIKKTSLKRGESYERKIKFGNETHTLAKGGLHSATENKVYHSDSQYVIIDVDVASFYVKASIEREYYPYHLGKEFLSGYKKIYDERIKLKPLGKTDKKIKGIVTGLKEAGVSVYGKSNDMQSWLYDPQMTLNICISGELSLLMLIEQQELVGSKCIMSNTDGASFMIERCNLDKFYDICKNWEKLTNYELEYQEYKSMWFVNVNNYIAITSDGTIKKKGDTFLTDYEIFKDKSLRIIPLALEAYFINNINPEDFITNHKNLMDFCSRGKVSKDFYLKSVDKNNNEVNLNKLIRYYISKEGVKLYKIKRDTCTTNAAKVSEIIADHPNQTIVNTIPKNIEEHLQNIDYQWYIKKVNEVIVNLEVGKKVKKPKYDNPNQIALF